MFRVIKKYVVFILLGFQMVTGIAYGNLPILANNSCSEHLLLSNQLTLSQLSTVAQAWVDNAHPLGCQQKNFTGTFLDELEKPENAMLKQHYKELELMLSSQGINKISKTPLNFSVQPIIDRTLAQMFSDFETQKILCPMISDIWSDKIQHFFGTSLSASKYIKNQCNEFESMTNFHKQLFPTKSTYDDFPRAYYFIQNTNPNEWKDVGLSSYSAKALTFLTVNSFDINKIDLKRLQRDLIHEAIILLNTKGSFLKGFSKRAYEHFIFPETFERKNKFTNLINNPIIGSAISGISAAIVERQIMKYAFCNDDADSLIRATDAIHDSLSCADLVKKVAYALAAGSKSYHQFILSRNGIPQFVPSISDDILKKYIDEDTELLSNTQLSTKEGFSVNLCLDLITPSLALPIDKDVPGGPRPNIGSDP